MKTILQIVMPFWLMRSYEIYYRVWKASVIGVFMLVRQIKKWGDNFTYLIADEVTLEGAVIDPGFNAEAVIKAAREEGVKVKYVIVTHHHFDHTMGIGLVKRAFRAAVAAFNDSKVDKDVVLADGDLLKIGGTEIKVMHTPGHTKDGICLLVGGAVFTGDTLFVGECGRTDFREGDSKEMYRSLFGKLMALDDATIVYPGHDYGQKAYSTIGEERANNYTLKKRTIEEFVRFMKEP